MTEIDTSQESPELVEPTPPTEPGAPEQTPAETARSPHLSAATGYVHVGPGAEECEHGEDGSCKLQQHFHAWVRLPNQFERQDLQEHAAAAAARKRRVMRDPESDARVIVDGELEGILHRGDRDVLVAEIVGVHFLEDHLEALKEVEREHEDLYIHIDDDKERLRVLEEMPAEERPEDEYTSLRRHISDHTEAVTAARDQLEEPRRLALADRSDEELIEIVRDQRIDGLASAAHQEEYAAWEWYVCTFVPQPPSKPGWPSERYYHDFAQYKHAPSEVLDAIAGKIVSLEREAQANLKDSSPANHG